MHTAFGPSAGSGTVGGLASAIKRSTVWVGFFCVLRQAQPFDRLRDRWEGASAGPSI